MSAPFRLRVYWEDTDASGVVYHANYLRWFERARTERLSQLGFNQQALLQQAGIGFTVASLNIRYIRPARLEDELLVVTRVCHVGKASVGFEQELHYAQSDSSLLASASVRVGCIGLTDFKPHRMPQDIENALKREIEHVG